MHENGLAIRQAAIEVATLRLRLMLMSTGASVALDRHPEVHTLNPYREDCFDVVDQAMAIDSSVRASERARAQALGIGIRRNTLSNVTRDVGGSLVCVSPHRPSPDQATRLAAACAPHLPCL